MRPTPIPDNEVWENAVRRVIAPPNGDLTNPHIALVEAVVDRSPSTGALCLSVRCILEDGELEHLAAGGTIWLTFWGAMTPWAATVVPPQDPIPGGPADAHELLVEALEDALVEYDERGDLFGTTGAGAQFLAQHLANTVLFRAPTKETDA